MKIPHLNEGRVWDAVNFGIGLTLGFVLVSGGIKLIDKFSGGIIPNEFSESIGEDVMPTKYGYYGSETFNTLDNIY